MKILLVGRSGFIGHNLYDFLKASGNYDVEAFSHKEFDVLCEEKVAAVLKNGNYDVVLNCLDSTPANGYMERRLRMYMNLANHNDLYGKMIYFGSGAEFGKREPLHNVSEADIGREVPDDEYGLAMYIMNMITNRSPNIYNLRLFGIFGNYEHWQTRFISNAICKNIMGYPITIRQDRRMSYTDVCDLCKIVEKVIICEPQYHDYNVIPKTTFMLSELANMVNDIGNVNVPIYIAKEGTFSEYTGNNDRIMNEFCPSFSDMKTSISNLYAFYMQNSDIVDKYNLLYQ